MKYITVVVANVTAMAAKGRSLAAVLKAGLMDEIVKEQETCRRKLQNSRTKIAKKYLSYKGVHS